MPRQNGCHFADNIFKCIFLNENIWIRIKISLNFVPKGPNNKMPALVQIMAWCRPGDKLLSEPMMFSLPTHISVTQPQWVNSRTAGGIFFCFIVLKTMGSFLQNAHKRHSIACLYGQDMGVFCEFKVYQFSAFVTDILHQVHGHFLWNCSQVNVTITFHDKSTQATTNKRPLPEWMLTHIYVAIWSH